MKDYCYNTNGECNMFSFTIISFYSERLQLLYHCVNKSCASGWLFLRGYCYKNILFSNPGGFEMLTSSLVVADLEVL